MSPGVSRSVLLKVSRENGFPGKWEIKGKFGEHVAAVAVVVSFCLFIMSSQIPGPVIMPSLPDAGSSSV